MSCSPFDLRDYFFGELGDAEKRQADLHLKGCASCREELSSLRSTQAILMSVPDEEIPQRIGFVSDRVYEPSALRRWWGAVWSSGPRLGFASAALLSASLFFSALHRQPLSADIARQVNEAVVKAVADSDARHQQETAKLLAAFRDRMAADNEIQAKYDAANYRVAMERSYR